eukprot:15421702-Alexandrium_andersonii.AAC.1
MSASLVGSEMCIRDRLRGAPKSSGELRGAPKSSGEPRGELQSAPGRALESSGESPGEPIFISIRAPKVSILRALSKGGLSLIHI